jgi:hypothetical protein
MTTDLTKQIEDAANALTGLKSLLSDDRVSLTAKQVEQITGVKANTVMFWAWKDAQTPPDAPKIGPPSFKCGRRRLWPRAQLLEWLDRKQRESGIGA